MTSSFNVSRNVRTRADKILISIGVGDPADSRPVLATLQHPIKRIGRLLPSELVFPVGLQQVLGSVGGVLQDFGAGVHLLVDLDQSIGETVQLSPRL